MRVTIEFAREQLEVEVSENSLVGVRRHATNGIEAASGNLVPAPSLTDPAAAMRCALERPLDFPALRQALTPDDRVAVVVDTRIPRLAELLSPLLEHLRQVSRGALTLLTAADEAAKGQPEKANSHGKEDEEQGLSHLPFSVSPLLPPGVHHQVHDATNRKKLSYLATTRRGRRVYLNRTVVDADQVVVLSRCGYDPLLGYGGSEGALYPALADEETRRELQSRLSLAAPGTAAWPVRKEAEEVAWLLGAPFMIQVIQGSGEDILHIVGGLAESSREGRRLLDARWRTAVDRQANTVVAGISGDPARHGFAEMARALACAARVVTPGGRIILLSRAEPALGRGAKVLRQAGDPEEALAALKEQTSPDVGAAFQWASSVKRASVYLLSGIPHDTAEELFTTPLDEIGQVQRLLQGDGSKLFLPEADKMMAVAED